MRKSPKFSPEVIERAVRMVFEVKDQYPSQWAAIESIASKIGCTGETLSKWVRQGERDSGVLPGTTTTEQQRIKELECEVRDRGSQYVSIRYSERLAEAGIEPSVGSTGDSYDNALAETINGLYKAEIIHRRGPWKTREAVELATLECVSWFNHHRLLEPIGYIPPAEAEANYWHHQAQTPRMKVQATSATPQGVEP